MTNFEFITDEHFRNAIERDKKELDQCLENHLYKSTLLLAGSIIEAILVDFFITFPLSDFPSNKVLKAELAYLLNRAEEEKLISPKVKDISIVIKNYRNLIHPGQEYRLKEKIDRHSATVAAHLTEMVIEEIAENYVKKLGYTANQAIQKVYRDPSCRPIFPFMINGMKASERIKLFTDIPHVYSEEMIMSDEWPDENLINSFIQLHSQLKTKVSKELLLSETRKVYEHITTTSELEALFYCRFFVDNLSLLPSEQRETIVSYLLNSLGNGTKEQLERYIAWDIFRSFGAELNNDKHMAQLMRIIHKQLNNPDSRDSFFSILKRQITSGLKQKYRDAVIENLQRRSWDKKAADWAVELQIPF